MAETVAIIGDGAMGTVCAVILANKGYSVTLWGHDGEQIEQIEQGRENRRFLPSVRLPLSVELTANDELAFKEAGLVISAVPCVYLRRSWQRLAGYIHPGLPIVSVTKGIENDTLMRPTQILRDVLTPRTIAVLSGPNIAGELARSLPATSTVASSDTILAD